MLGLATLAGIEDGAIVLPLMLAGVGVLALVVLLKITPAAAVVVTFGYAAFLMGPGLVGYLVNRLGIHHAMAVPAILCVAIIALAATMPKTDDDLTG